MSQEKTTLEIIAASVEEAVQKGLEQLELPEDAVEVEVLDSGSRGLFGIGGRHARIRLTIKEPEQPRETEGKTGKREKRAPREPAPVSEKTHTNKDQQTEDEILKISKQVVSELLENMHVKAVVDTSYIPPEDKKNGPVVLVNIQGNDLSILIGRRSETLNALQYIASLIINKHMGHLVPLMIDVQGFRTRRERQLRQIAQKMADQAIATGRRQVLEPMPANERRLIHLALRDSDKVDTESIGEEPNRKVTIVPKK
jgi:spoIIIJ-associated protein